MSTVSKGCLFAYYNIHGINDPNFLSQFCDNPECCCALGVHNETMEPLITYTISWLKIVYLLDNDTKKHV